MTRLAMALLLAALAAVASAQSDEDIFAEGAFDEAVTASQASAEATKLTWLGGVSLLSDTTLLLPDRDAYGAQSLLSGKAFLKADKPDLGQFFVSYSFNHTLMSSTNDAAYRIGFGQAEPSIDTPKFQLSELHLSFDVAKVLFVRVGNQLVSWGSSVFWSPADFVNQRPADSQAAIDTRTGKPGVRLHLPFSGGNVFVFADLSQTLSGAGVPQDLGQTGSVAFKADATLAGFNLGVLGDVGASDKPVKGGATFSGRLFGFDVWGEYGATLPLNGHDFAWAASVGGEKALGDWTLRGEWFENPSGHADTELTWQNLADFRPFQWGQRYAFASLSKSKLLGDGIDGSVTGIANLTDTSYTASASLSVRLPALLPVTFRVGYADGPDKREFTLQNGAKAWTLGVRTVLEF